MIDHRIDSGVGLSDDASNCLHLVKIIADINKKEALDLPQKAKIK